MLIAGVHLAACGSSAERETVATVVATPITGAELGHWASISEHASHRSAADARSHALDYLIVSAWVRGEAKRLGVSVDPGEVGRDIESRAATFVGGPEEFKASLARSGLSLADARSQTETKLLYDRVEGKIAAEVRIPSATVLKYYHLHRRRFVIPERRYFLSDSRVSKRQAADDRARVLAGAPFPPHALHESLSTSEIDNSRPRRKRIARAIFAARPGVVLGPFHNEPVEFYTMVKVTRIVPARYETFEEVKAKIERTLTAAARRRALESFRQSWQARWRRATSCRRSMQAPACDRAPSAPLALAL